MSDSITYNEPTEEDNKMLTSMWAAVLILVQEKFNTELHLNADSLEYLQKLVEGKLVDTQNDYAVQALGVVFGEIVAANIDGLAWVIVHDGDDRYFSLRYNDTKLQINAIDMVTKRLFDNIAFNFLDMFTFIKSQIEELKDQL